MLNKKNHLSSILILTCIFLFSMFISSCQDQTQREPTSEELKEIEQAKEELEQKEKELKEREEKLKEENEAKRKAEEEEEAKRKAEEEAKRKAEEEEAQRLAELVSEEEKLSDEIAVKKLTPEAIVKVKIPKQDVIVKINQIENKDFPNVRLFVSVTDKDGNPLELENPNLFIIEENGEELPRAEIKEIQQQKSAKDTELIPLSAVLAIDKSGSMALNAEETVKLAEEEQPIFFAKNAAIEFLDKIQSYDNVEIIAFDHNIENLGKNYRALEKIASIQASGHTALYGALYSSVRTLESKEGIKAVILLTDGKNDVERVPEENKLSHMPLESGLELAEKLSIPVFTIGLGKGVDHTVLKKIAKDTHATYFSTGNKEEIARLYDKIRNIINNQYVIRYNTKHLTTETEVTVDLYGPNDTRKYQNPEELVEKEKKIKEKIETLDDQINEYDDKVKKVEKKEKELVKKEKELDDREDKLDKKEASLEETQKELEKKKEELAKKDEELKKLEKELASIDNQLNEKDERLAELQDQLSNRQNTLNKQKEDLESKENELNKMQDELDKLKKSLDEREEKLNNLNKTLTNKRAELDTYSETLSQRESNLKELSNNLDKKEVELDKLEKELINKNNELLKKEKELNKLSSDLNALEEQLKKERERLLLVKQQLKELLDSTVEEVDEVNP